MPKVPNELWRALLEHLVMFRKTEPWRWVPDSALAAYVDASGQPWFACTLGKAGQMFGLSLYRGADGLRMYRTVQALGTASSSADLRRMQDALTVWYGSEAKIDPLQGDIFKKLGYAPAPDDQLGWPHVRSHRPGFFPWFPDADEVRVLTAVIPAVLRFVEYFREHPSCYRDHAPLEMPTLPAAVATELEWRTWMTPEPDAFGPPVLIPSSDPVMWRIAALPQCDETLEVDWFYTAEPAAEEGRPFYPRAVAVFQNGSGFCYGAKIIGPDDDVAFVAAELVLDAVEQHGGRPSLILATKPELIVRLEPLARSLGAEMKTVRQLKAATEFREGLEGHAGSGGGRPRQRRGRP